MRRGILVTVLVLAMLLPMVPLAPLVSADPGNAISGTVVLKQDATPMADATVKAFNASTGALVNSTVTNGSGGYLFHLPDGTYNITVELMGYITDNPLNNWAINGDGVVDEFATRGPFQLVPVFGDVTGMVTYNGTPVVGAEVTVRNGDTVLATTFTDGDGEYVITAITGNRTLRVENDGFAVNSAAVTILDGETVWHNVSLEALSKFSLTGRVETAQGGLANVNVTVALVSGALPPTSTMTNSTGDFRFEDLIEGVYNITVKRDAFIQWIVPQTIVLDHNKTLSNPLAMREAFGNVQGKVFNGTFMISDAAVRLLDAQGNEVEVTTTNSRGEYTFIGIPTGNYVIKVDRNDFISQERDIRINASDVVVMDFDLERIDRSYLFGQDLAHSLMIVGIAISMLFLIATAYLRNRIIKDPSLLYLKPDEEDEL